MISSETSQDIFTPGSTTTSEKNSGEDDYEDEDEGEDGEGSGDEHGDNGDADDADDDDDDDDADDDGQNGPTWEDIVVWMEEVYTPGRPRPPQFFEAIDLPEF